MKVLTVDNTKAKVRSKSCDGILQCACIKLSKGRYSKTYINSEVGENLITAQK